MLILFLDVCSDAHMVLEDIKRTISELEQDSSLPAVGVELVDNELAMLYMNSKKSEVSVVRLNLTNKPLLKALGYTFPNVSFTFCSSHRRTSETTHLCFGRLCLWLARFRTP